MEKAFQLCMIDFTTSHPWQIFKELARSSKDWIPVVNPMANKGCAARAPPKWCKQTSVHVVHTSTITGLATRLTRSSRSEAVATCAHALMKPLFTL
jgi:hypothetical protein